MAEGGTEAEGGADAGESAAGSAGAASEGGAAPNAGSAGDAASPGVGGDSSPAGSGNASEGPISAIDLSDVDPNALSVTPDPPGLANARIRATTLLATLSQSQKLALVQGSPGLYVGNVAAVGAIPALSLQDGPAGVRDFSGVTGFPAPITLAASWDRELVEAWGSAMGAEMRGKGVMIQLGPMMNLARVPTGGRNFEGFGEDPYLAAELAARDVVGIQSQKVVATAKHFLGNEQETNRFGGNSQIDARTLHEVYYAPFEASVRAGVGAVMCSYNRLNGEYACQNPSALADLKTGLGFSGWVMSDWGATKSVSASANAGLDMEQPYGTFFGSLGTAISNAAVAQARLDDMVLRILTALTRVGVLDDSPVGTPASNVNPGEHVGIAQRAAATGITLLKNQDGLLPLDSSKTIAVIGRAGHAVPAFGGGGSAQVKPPYVVSPFTEIQLRSGNTVTYSNGTNDAAALAASAADVAIVFAAVDSSEGADRPSLSLGFDALVTAVANANPNTIVVLNVPGAVLMPWLDQVAAVLVAWYPGQENGKAITPILFGDENPSGKLPVTFPKSASDLPQPSSDQNVPYAEGLAIGYRALDAASIAPLFPFGYGLSYTTFSYTGLELYSGSTKGSIAAQFELTNTGIRAGAEVAQLYLSYPPGSGEPPRVLRGFERVALAPGESRTVRIELDPRALSCWNPTSNARYVPTGTYHVTVGGSSRNLPLEVEIRVTGTGIDAGGSGGSGGSGGDGNDGLRCANPIELPSELSSYSLGTTEGVCLRTKAAFDTVGCSGWTGRTLKVNGRPMLCDGTKEILPLALDGYHYFEIGAGQVSYAALYWYTS